jgi:hypothetical protein
LHSLTRFRLCGGRQDPFSSFALLFSFSAVPCASGPVFTFCVPALVFDGTEGVGSRFNVLCSRTSFRLYRRRQIPFSCFASPNSFSAEPRASGLVFMFCGPELVFGGTEGVGSCFHILPVRTLFRRYRGRRGPVFMFCAPGLVFGGTEGVGSHFHVLHFRTLFRGSEGVGSRFLVLRPRTYCRWYRGRRVPFSFFRGRTHFRRSEGVRSSFHVLRSQTHFRRFRGHRVPFSSLASPHSFSTVPWASGPILKFCAPELIFSDNEGVRSRFYILRAQTRFQRYRRRRVPFSCFACPN